MVAIILIAILLGFVILMAVVSGLFVLELINAIARVAPWMFLTVLAIWLLKEVLKKKK